MLEHLHLLFLTTPHVCGPITQVLDHIRLLTLFRTLSPVEDVSLLVSAASLPLELRRKRYGGIEGH
jgi:hypothetical protein